MTERETIETIRAETEASFRAARERVAERFGARGAVASGASQSRARELLRASRKRARELLAGAPGQPGAPEQLSAPESKPEPSLQDLHTVERLVSYVRHSVVRVCFYNLKLFCPSLIDEHDDHVRQQVATNIDQLGAAQEELSRFFAQTLSDGQTIAALFPECERKTREQFGTLIALAGPARDRLDDEAVRQDFANRVPALIDGVMDALQEVQKELDSRKMAVGEVVECAVSLARPLADEAGLSVTSRLDAVPKVFGDEGALLNCFVELITNAAKYSEATELTASVELVNNGGQYVQATFADNGRGVAPDELATCLTRGASHGGTGEGLPMIVQIVEAEHLGEFEIIAEPGEGSHVVVRLPVKWQEDRRRSQETGARR